MLKQFTRIARSEAAGQAPWGVADQVISSVTNFVIVFLAARQTGPVEFGHFSVAFTVYIVVLWVNRSLVGEPLIVRFTNSEESLRREAGGSAVGAAVLVGAAIALMVAVPVALTGYRSPTLLAMAVFLPLLMAQDTYRYLLIASGKTRSAAVNDLVWLIVQLAMASVFVLQQRPVVWLIFAFGVGSVSGVILGSRQAGVLPNLRTGAGWAWQTADLGLPYLVELVAIYGVSQLAMLTIAAAGEVATVGALRTALLMLSPVTVVCSGLFLVGAAEAVRLRQIAPHSLMRFSLRMGSTSALVAGWTVVLLLVPDSLGRMLLGENWAPGSEVLIPVAAMTIATLYVLAGMIGLRALDAARRTLRARLWAVPAFALATLAGVRVSGAWGAAVGLAVATVLSAALTWIAFRRELSTTLDPSHLSAPTPAKP